jgi:hypothetical protein
MEALKTNKEHWTKTSDHVFWGEIAPCDHVVQIYENDDAFLDLLTGFVSGGFNADESVVLIATEAHLNALDRRLEDLGHAVPALRSGHRYIRLDAEEILSRFMVNDWPDETLFRQVVSEVITQAKRDNRKVRAFGEMVAILWAQGQVGATVRLEQLWNKFCENEAFCLFCAYPQNGFTQDASESLLHICSAHSKMVKGATKSKKELFYKIIEPRITL